MSRQATNFTADATKAIATVARVEDGVDGYLGTIYVQGTFGGGTVTLQASADGGTTKVDLKDASGVVVQLTENGVVDLQHGLPSKLGEEPIIYAALSGATSPDLDVIVYDNR